MFKTWMIRTARATCVWLVAAGSAAAQLALGDFHVFDTRFGQVQVVGGEVDQVIYFNDRFYDDLLSQQVWIHGGFAIAEAQEDWVLITRQHGGNGCFPVHVLLHVTPQGLTASQEFGHCMAQPLDVRVSPGQVEIDMSHPDVTIAYQTVTFDGVTLSSATTNVAVTATPAGAESDVLRWLGQHPARIFDDMSERARFALIMPEDQISGLAQHVDVANGTYQRGDWVIGQGCLPHQCDTARGVWGVRISDGAAGAAFIFGGGEVMAFGLAISDPTLRQVIEAHRPRPR